MILKPANRSYCCYYLKVGYSYIDSILKRDCRPKLIVLKFLSQFAEILTMRSTHVMILKAFED